MIVFALVLHTCTTMSSSDGWYVAPGNYTTTCAWDRFESTRLYATERSCRNAGEEMVKSGPHFTDLSTDTRSYDSFLCSSIEVQK